MTISKTSSCLVNSPMYVGGWGLQKHVSQNSRLVSKTRLPDEGVIERHLRGDDGRGGDFVAGVYPLLPGDTCWFLAADFDKASWVEDANALLETCRARGVTFSLYSQQKTFNLVKKKF